MSQKLEIIDRRRCYSDILEEMHPKSRSRSCSEYMSPKIGNSKVDNEKRVRREIANCNERRRMQSINAGFENLRVLLPPVQDPEKLSKATILQLTAKFINSLLMRVTALEHEVAVYRQSVDLNSASVLADITAEVSSGFLRKRRSEDEDFDTCSKMNKRNMDETTFLDLDDGNTSGRSSECYENNFGCSPSSITARSSHIASVSPTESTCSTAARLEHLVMAIEQIEGNTLMGIGDKVEPISHSYSYDSQNSSLYYKFTDSVTPVVGNLSYSLPVSDSNVLKPSVNSFTEDLILRSSSSDLSNHHASSVADNENSLPSAPVVDCFPVSRLTNRPIPHKYLHRPQVVVNNSH